MLSALFQFWPTPCEVSCSDLSILGSSPPNCRPELSCVLVTTLSGLFQAVPELQRAVEVRNQIHMGLNQLADSTYSKKPVPFLLAGKKSLYQGVWLLQSQEMATQLGEVRDSPSPELGAFPTCFLF